MTGDDLSSLIANPPPPAPLLVDQFLPANCCFMMTGETGRGKSVIATQLAACLTSATPMFGTLKIFEPQTVYYMQLEGSFHEQVRRMHFMKNVVPINTKLLEWDHDRRTSPLSRYDRIAKAFSKPPCTVILDPAYKITGGDLSKAEEALKVVKFSDRIMELGSTVVLIHHPHREKYTIAGKKIEEDDFYYGHSFIKNHVEMSYVFKPLDSEGERGQLIRKKRREENTLPIIEFTYHPETYTCSMLPIGSVSTKRERAIEFLKSLNGASTTFREVKKKAEMSDSTLRELQKELKESGQLKLVDQVGKSSIWIPTFDGVSG